MTEYQRITLKGRSERECVVSAMEYPYQQAGILYIKFIKYNEFNLLPEKFLTVQPQDILKREYEWSQEAEDELVGAAEEAAEQEMMTREMYQKAAEEEFARRAAMINTPEAEGGDRGGLFG